MNLGAGLDQRLMSWSTGAMELQVIGVSAQLQYGGTGVLENVILIICRLLRLYIKADETQKKLVVTWT
jgi:hypothetical protein